MLIRITKQYNNRSSKNGLIEVDKIEFDSIDDAAQFVSKVNANNNIDFEIIDYDAALISTGQNTPEIIHNPTGGGVGKINIQ